jgi:hypothetical protein
MRNVRCRLEGVVRAQLTPEISEPLAGATIRLARLASGEESHAEEIAHASSDAAGNFVLDFRATETPAKAALAAVLHGAAAREPVILPLGVVQPAWWPGVDGFSARCELQVEAGSWARARRDLDRWTILGQVRDLATGEPLSGVLVRALDRDLVRHDALGRAVTDAAGQFRIDYSSAQFRSALPLLEGLERGGPDLCFRVERLDGRILLDELTGAGRAVRRDVGQLLQTELRVAATP